MKVVHWIKQRDMRTRYDYVVLCTDEKMRHPDWDKRSHLHNVWASRWDQPANNKLFTNGIKEVTCPACVKAVIEIKQREIAELEKKLQE